MLFNSAIFMVFIAIFAPLYWIFRRNVGQRNLLLIFASYIFYGWWDWRFLVLVAVSTSVDYLAAMGAAGKPVGWRDFSKSAAFLAAVAAVAVLAAGRDLWILGTVAGGIILYAILLAVFRRLGGDTSRRLWLALSLTTNLGILAFFKYFGFFLESIESLLRLISPSIGQSTLHIVLPVGLSFYTFQAISRTIDSYRGAYEPQPNLINYAAFHAFFPQLVAGPIERAAHLMPQFERVLPITGAMLDSGLRLFLYGLAKKMIVADNLAPIVERVFGAPAGHTAGEYAAAILAFTLQIYCDFSGYSDMARGLARCLGFDLMINFARPYFSTSPSEFWRRWHISLSSWLRDYVYIPLGGNRSGLARTNANLMNTMLIGGLWHGASWTFVAWGGLHGAILVVFRALGIDRLLARSPSQSKASRFMTLAGGWMMTMTVVMLAWVLFRAPDFPTALAVVKGIFGVQGWTFGVFAVVLAYGAPLAAIEAGQRYMEHRSINVTPPAFLRFNTSLFLLGAILCFAAYTPQPFIYFDF